jgi:tetratricopeptide (TPR) repeat protein
VESAIVLSPHHPDLASIAAEIENEKARVRNDLIRRANGRARAAYGAGDLETALTCTNQALALDPADIDAVHLKSEIEHAVAARKQEARIRAAVDDARRTFISGEHDAALRLLEVQPASNPLVATALEELRSAQRAIEQRQRAAREPRSGSNGLPPCSRRLERR